MLTEPPAALDHQTGAARTAEPAVAPVDAGAPQDPQGVDAQRTKLLVEKYLENAQSLLNQGNPEAARLELLKAREHAPGNDAVAKMLEAVAAQLQDPSGTTGSFADTQLRLRRIHEERARSQVRAHLDSARAAVAERNYDRALTELRRARMNIEIGADIAWGDLATQVEEMLAQTEAGRDAAEAAERDAVQRDMMARKQAADAEVAARRTARIQDLLRKAALAFQRRQFQLAQDLSFAALEVDNTNETARDLHNASIKANRETATEDYYQQMSREIRRMLEESEDLKVPQVDILRVDPAVWERASRRVSSTLPTAAIDPDDAGMFARLDTETISGVSFTADDGSYDEVKSRISAMTNIPIIITTEANEAISGEGLVMEMDVTAPIKIADFLDLMVGKSETLAWTVTHGVVEITTKEKAGGRNYLHLHNVKDLIFAKTEFLPPQIRDVPSGEDDSESPRTGGEGEEKTYFVELDGLIGSIRDATGVEYWDAEGGGTIEQAESGFLLVNANAEMQERVRSVLEAMRRFATTVVTIDSKFLDVSQNYLQEIGVDFRGLGGSGSKGDNATLDDLTSGLDDNTSRGFDNSGTGDSASSPSSGAFFNDGGDGDVRARTENYFVNDTLGRALSTTGGATAALVYLNDLQLQAIIRAVEKKEHIQELNGQTLTVLNNERGHVAVINQTAYIRDFDVEVAQAAFIADPKVDVIQDGVVLDVKPTILHDRKHITLDMQPTVAELLRPIPTFTTSLAGSTTPVTLQLPQLTVRSFATTATVPDGGSVLIGGLRQILTRERRAEVPVFSKIPIISFFFKTEGVADENTSLMVLVRARITDVSTASR